MRTHIDANAYLTYPTSLCPELDTDTATNTDTRSHDYDEATDSFTNPTPYDAARATVSLPIWFAIIDTYFHTIDSNVINTIAATFPDPVAATITTSN